MLTVTDLKKTFASDRGAVRAVDGLHFTVPHGQCYTLVGPSGCGKTTALRCIAGLEDPDSGRIEIAGEVVHDSAAGTSMPTHQRQIGIVFQSYAIWPHYSVFENVAYPLRVRRQRVPRDEIEERTMAMLDLVGMKDLAQRPAPHLSGGQQQRVALARSLVHRPKLLLLDEPLSNLDARLREHMRKELADLIGKIGITALLVTHDQIEALSLAQRIAVMSNGRIVQEASPREIYAAPASPFVAEFIGGANVVDGTVVAREGRQTRIALPGDAQTVVVESDAPPGETVRLVIRPEAVRLSTSPLDGDNVLTGRVRAATFIGHAVDCTVEIAPGLSLRVMASPDVQLATGAPVWLELNAVIALGPECLPAP